MIAIFTMILLSSGFIGLVMEVYKKTIRKDRANEGEVRLVAMAFSAFMGYVLFRVIDPDFLPDGVRFNAWVSVIYAICVYVLQLPACMKIWKPILKDFIERKAKNV
jgi:hypothetical protein